MADEKDRGDHVPHVLDAAGNWKIAKPFEGWQRGLELLMQGRCPYCRHRLLNVSVSKAHGLTWACFEGCNP